MAVTPGPFEVIVQNKAFHTVGEVGNPVSVVAQPRHNALSTATVTLDADHPRVGDLLTDGARVKLRYEGAHLLGGPVRRALLTGPAAESQLVVTVEDDWRLLQRVLGWPNPTGTLAQQGAVSAYDTKTGAAETVVKWFVTRNVVTRLGLPVTVATDQARGATVTVGVRMHPLADRLLPVIDQAGIGVTVTQTGPGFVVDCYQPATRQQALTEDAGIVLSWELETNGAGATRAIIGGPNEGTAREFELKIDTTRESATGDLVEVFVDARDVDAAAPNRVALMEARGLEQLTELAPTSGLKVQLGQVGVWSYGRQFRVGDRVTAMVGPAPITDVIREVTLTWDRDTGPTATATADLGGQVSPDPAGTLRRTLNTFAAAIRDIRAGR